MSGITLLVGLYATVEYSLTGAGDWRPIPGITEYSESGGDRPTEDVVTFDGVGKIAGLARTPEVTANAQYLPHHQSWRDLRSSFVDGTPLWFRITTMKDTIFATLTGTVAISMTGAVTFAGAEMPDVTSTDFAPGNVIKVANKNHVVDKISDAGAFTVNPAPSAAVAATANYSIIAPSIRRTYRADVTLTDRMTINPEGSLTTPINISPRAQLPTPELVVA